MVNALLMLAGVSLVLLGTQLLVLAMRVWTSGQTKYVAAYELTKNPLTAIRGEVDALHSGNRDFRVACGIAVDLKTGRLIAQGRVSDEIINGLIK